MMMQIYEIFLSLLKEVHQRLEVSEESIRISQRGRVETNIARWVTMYISRDYSDESLKVIAETFHLNKTKSIPTTINKLKSLMLENSELELKVEAIKAGYDT